MMHLQILLPTEVLVDTEATKIVGEAENGSFCLLPRHVDFVTSLPAGILSYIDTSDELHYVGVARGILVKSARDVCVSVEFGVQGSALGELRQLAKRHFEADDDRERRAATAVAHLEADFVRRFLTLEGRPHVA